MEQENNIINVSQHAKEEKHEIEVQVTNVNVPGNFILIIISIGLIVMGFLGANDFFSNSQQSYSTYFILIGIGLLFLFFSVAALMSHFKVNKNLIQFLVGIMLTIFCFVFFFHSFFVGLFTFIFALFGIWIASSALMKIRDQKIEEQDLNKNLDTFIGGAVDKIIRSDENNTNVTVIDNTKEMK